MKVGLISDKYNEGKKIVDIILSNPKYELVYINLCNSDVEAFYDSEDYCADVEILFTAFEKTNMNNYFINKYGTKVKLLDTNDSNFSFLIKAS